MVGREVQGRLKVRESSSLLVQRLVAVIRKTKVGGRKESCEQRLRQRSRHCDCNCGTPPFSLHPLCPFKPRGYDPMSCFRKEALKHVETFLVTCQLAPLYVQLTSE